LTRVIKRTVKLHRVQSEFVHSPALYRAFVGGRGSGKSWALSYDLIRKARRGRLYMMVSPTYTIMADTDARTFCELARDFGVLADRKISPPHVTLTTGAEILFRSADNPEKLRGPNLSGVVLNEASLMPRDAYDISIASLRQGGEVGWLTAGFTPKGPTHWTFDVFATGKPDTALFRAATAANPFLDPAFADTIRRQYGPTQFSRQELGGEFVQLDGAEWSADLIDRPDRWFTEWPANLVGRVIALDPSKGARQDSDYQAYAMVGVDAKSNLWVDVEANRESVQEMVARGIRLCRSWGPVDRFVVEDNDGLGMLVTEMQRQLREWRTLVPVAAVRNTVNKIYRLRRLGGYFAADHPDLGPQLRIRDTPGGRLFAAQAKDFPRGEFDDCLDATEMALRALEEMCGPGRR
jgi:phage terminase large subunit-like protein